MLLFLVFWYSIILGCTENLHENEGDDDGVDDKDEDEGDD